MSGSRENEVAEAIVNDSIIAAAYEAARQYPQLGILCPWCRESVRGASFADHAVRHRIVVRDDSIPSHWMAL